MRIKGGIVYRDGEFVEGKDIYIEEARFVSGGSEKMGDIEEMDASGCYVIPGLIDIHFHGCAGHDFCDASFAGLQKMAEYELHQGVTSIHPASMTLPEELLTDIFSNARLFYEYQHQNREVLKQESELVGIYMEGPFICMEKKGAQNPQYISRPDKAMFHRLQKVSGNLIRICLVAPEIDGAKEFIQKMAAEVRISEGHTVADYEQAAAGFVSGARQVTHLYNAMPPFAHREPGVVGAACDNEAVSVEMICDGIHLHPAAIRTSFKMFGRERIILISDSMSAAGMEDGAYSLGGQAVTVQGKRATLTENGAIAGSATNLFDCMRYTVHTAGIPLESVVECVTANPAKAIGIWEQYGSITPGKYADCIIMDEDMNIRHIIKHGMLVE